MARAATIRSPETRPADRASGDRQVHAGFDERPVEGLLFLEFPVDGAGAGRGRRDRDGLDDLSARQDVFAPGVLDRPHEEVVQGDQPPPFGRNGLEARAVGEQCDGGRGGVNAAAEEVRVEDRVEAVLAVLRVAVVAALLATVEIRQTVVPTARPLAEVAAQRGPVADQPGRELREQLAEQRHPPG